MKTPLFLLLALVLVGCQPSSSVGWTYEADELYKHYDSQHGIVCYTFTRGSNSRSNLSCVKVI